MPAFGRRGMIAAIAILLAAIAIGVIVARWTRPTFQPTPVAPPPQTVIGIDPAPSPTPGQPVPAPEPLPPIRHSATRRIRPAPASTTTGSDGDPVTVTTINSW